MLTVNFMPWREWQRSYQQRQTLLVQVCAIIVSCLIVMFVSGCLRYSTPSKPRIIRRIKNVYVSAKVKKSVVTTDSILRWLNAARKHGICFSKINYQPSHMQLSGFANRQRGLDAYLTQGSQQKLYSHSAINALGNNNIITFNVKLT